MKKICGLIIALMAVLGMLASCQVAEVGKNPVNTPTDSNYETELPVDGSKGGSGADVSDGTGGETSPGQTTPNQSKGPMTAPNQGNTPGVTAKPGASTEEAGQTTPEPYTLPYIVKVNRKQNVVTVYTYDNKGKYTKPVKAMVCSTGINNGTPVGTFYISDKYTWRALFGNVYGQYAVRFTGNILFHSVPYVKTNKSTLKAEEYNKLGIQASDGCVRLSVIDAKWIYDNCGPGTRVIVFDGNDFGPLGKPEAQNIPNSAGWDPTDPDNKNPWKLSLPLSIQGVSEKQVQRNGVLNLLEGITAKDAKGKPVSEPIAVTGKVNFHKTGSYPVTYTIAHISGELYKVDTNILVVDHTPPVVQGLENTYLFSAERIQEATYEKLMEHVVITDDGDLLDSSRMVLMLEGLPYSPDLLKAGSNLIEYVVKDDNGNAAAGSFIILVETEEEQDRGK